MDRTEAARLALGYAFRDEDLLARALRHASAGGADGTDNERLEFLGDAVIGLAAAAWLFERFPEAAEGVLTERRALLVSRAHLARIGRRIGLEPLVETRLAAGKASRLPDSVVGGALEALIGAIFLEAGTERASAVVRSLMRDDDVSEAQRNMKAELQHVAQKKYNCIPEYVLIQERTHAFGKSFCMAAEIEGRRFPGAWGRSKRDAERLAAREAMLVLQAETAANEDHESGV